MMRIAVCGGVYGNPWALRAMLDDARRRGCDRIVCLGDLGGFGARPNDVWPLLTDAGAECIAGNYDLAIAAGADDCGCGYADPRDNAYAQVMYDYTRRATSSELAVWMGSLPGEWRETVEGVDVHMVHGSPTAVNDFLWESLDDDEIAARLRASGAEVVVCTHTGIPWQRRVAGTLVVNAGTVGRSANDGDPRGWYAVLELDGGSARAELVGVAYDPAPHAAAIRDAGLPEAFAVTAETGWWTTCLEVVPPPERARGRFHCYRDAVPAVAAGATVGWASAARPPDDGLPSVSLFGSAAFPARLWIYTNFHCNLSCDYCAVASAPDARRRELPLERVRDLVDDAAQEGFRELYITGGEPFLVADLGEMVTYAAGRLPTTVLTNAMLFRGRRADALRRLAGLPGLALQVSLDGAAAADHDRHRGAGSWQRTLDGIAAARELGIRVLVSTTVRRIEPDELQDLRALLGGLGVAPDDHAVRPLVARGFSEWGIEVGEAELVPELTVSADGVHWHPVGADIGTSPDLLVAPGAIPLAEAKRLVVQRFLTLRQADGSLARPLACAI